MSERIARALDTLNIVPSDTLSSTGGTLAARPLSRADFLRRARSFRLVHWFAKKGHLAPMALARRGWYNTGVDSISCEGCGARLAAAAAAASPAALRSAHARGCVWELGACPREFAQLPCARAARVLVALEAKRIEGLRGEDTGILRAARADACAALAAVAPQLCGDPAAAAADDQVSLTLKAAARALAAAVAGDKSAAVSAASADSADSTAAGQTEPSLPVETTSGLLAAMGWRVADGLPPPPPPPLRALVPGKRARDDTGDSSGGTAAELRFECHLCGEVFSASAAAPAATGASLPPPPPPPAVKSANPAFAPAMSSLASALQRAAAAANRAVSIFSGAAGGDDRAASHEAAPSRGSQSVVRSGLPRHHWVCPYGNKSYRLSAAEHAGVVAAVAAAGGRAPSRRLLTAHVGAALRAVVHAVGDLRGTDATAIRLIAAAQGAPPMSSPTEDDHSESEEEEDGDGCGQLLPGWLLVLLRIVAADAPEST